MTCNDILNEKYILVTDESTKSNVYEGIYTTDLLSAAIKSSQSGNILITIISHGNTVATAMMIDLPIIIITESRKIDEVMINKANESGIAIISTPLYTYEVVIDLFQRGLL
jgi:hypothetical protein